MDSDLSFESSESIETIKTQRKRRTSLFGKKSNGTATMFADSNDTFSDSPTPPFGSRTRRLATWADNTDDLQQIRTIQSSDYQKENKQKIMDSNDNEVTPMIPDLEQVVDYELTQQVAEPPSAHNQIISFQDLDKNLLKHAAFASLDGIDLTQLTHFCLPESQVKEDDIPWGWDYLMSDVLSKLITDTDSNV